MKDIIFFSDLFYPTFPLLEVNLIRTLMSKGANVHLYMFRDDPRLRLDPYRKIYKHLNPTKITTRKDVLRRITRNDFLLSRFDYKYNAGALAASARRKNKCRVFMYDSAGIDMTVRDCPANYVAVKSEWIKQRLKKGKKYSKIFVTGTIHFDGVTINHNRHQFFSKYKLDPNRKLLLLVPANPGEANTQHNIDALYKEITQIIGDCKDVQLMIKGHPFDYSFRYGKATSVIRKKTKYGRLSSWEYFCKQQVPVCEPEDGYWAIKNCDLVVNVRSSIAMEIPMFYKPVVNVNRKNYVTNWAFDDSVMYDIGIEQLERFVNKMQWPVNKTACDRYVSNNCYSNDGRAYLRIANAVMSVL